MPSRHPYKCYVRKMRWGAWCVLSPSNTPYYAETWEEAYLVAYVAAQSWKKDAER